MSTAKPSEDILVQLDAYGALSDDELGQLATSEILAFYVVASMIVGRPATDASFTISNKAHDRLTEEIDRRVPPRIKV